jgi:hypothetical protein
MEPDKMKITLWHFAHNYLPPGEQLEQRHVPASTVCVHCSMDECIEHALIFYPYAREVWSEVKDFYGIHLNRKTFTSSNIWIFDYLVRGGVARGDNLEATVLAVTCWHIWDAYNMLREKHMMMFPTIVASKIEAYVDMIFEHLFRTKHADSREPSSLSRLAPPPTEMVLINVDVASSRRMGAGVVIWDHNGAFFCCLQ